MDRHTGTDTDTKAPVARTSAGADTAVAAVLLVLTAVVALVTAIALPVNQLTQPGGDLRVALAVEPAERALRAVEGLPAGTFLEAKPEQAGLSLHVDELPWALRLLTEAPASLRALCVGLAALVLWRLLVSFRAARPFDRQNPRLLVALAVLLLVGVVGGQLLEGLAGLLVLDHVQAGPGGPLASGFTLDLGPVLLAVVLLALADVFRRGRQLTDDVQGLV